MMGTVSTKEATVNILDIFQTFKTQEQAVEYLEQIRWCGRPVCPYCKSLKVNRHASTDRNRSRWQCQECHRAFSVTVGTIFHGTHIPLQNWFLLLGLMLNAKKSASACQIARDLGMRRPTVWSMMQRVRLAMANDQEQARLLHGIVEADETYVGGFFQCRTWGRMYRRLKICAKGKLRRAILKSIRAHL